MTPPANQQQQEQPQGSRKRKRPPLEKPTTNREEHLQSKAARLDTKPKHGPAKHCPQPGKKSLHSSYHSQKPLDSSKTAPQAQHLARPSKAPSTTLWKPINAHTAESTPTYPSSKSPESIHPPLSSQLRDLQTQGLLNIHDLTIISSSKIRLKVSRILELLSQSPHATKPSSNDPISKTSEAAESPDPTHEPKTKEKDVLIRLSAKSPVASKCISIVEIVKRNWLAAVPPPPPPPSGSIQIGVAAPNKEEHVKTRELWQYTQLRGVRFPCPTTTIDRGDGEVKGRKRRVERGGPGDGDAAAASRTEPQTKAPGCKNITASDNTTDTARKSAAKARPDDPSYPRNHRKVMRKTTYTDNEGFLVTREEEVWESPTGSDDSLSDRDGGGDPQNGNDGGAKGGADGLDQRGEAVRYGRGQTKVEGEEQEQEQEDEGLDDSGVTLPGASNNRDEEDNDETGVDANNKQDGSDSDSSTSTEFTHLPTVAEREKERARLALVAELQQGNEAKLKRARERPTAVLTVWLCTRRLDLVGGVVGGEGVSEVQVGVGVGDV